ncbi:hypothetical protein JCM8097_001459 [Rhodosporidiobolus ruineniae]
MSTSPSTASRPSLLTLKLQASASTPSKPPALQVPPTPSSPVHSITASQPPVLRLPVHLPPCPAHVQPVALEDLGALLEDDDDLRGVPELFLKDVLAFLAPRLLAGVESTLPLVPSPPSPPTASSSSAPPQLPASLPCLFRPLTPDALPPTHLLPLVFPPSSASFPSPSSDGPGSGAGPDTPREAPTSILVPIHALPWALASATIARAVSSLPRPPPSAPLPSPPAASLPTPPSSRPSSADSTAAAEAEQTLHLPLLPPLALPSLRAFSALHAFLYSRTPSALYSALAFPRLARRSTEDARRAEAAAMVEEVWKTAVGLEVAEEVVWGCMEEVWRREVVGMGLGGESGSEEEEEEGEEQDEWSEDGEEESEAEGMMSDEEEEWEEGMKLVS